jgi:uncharacterized protein (DUF1697 family)
MSDVPTYIALLRALNVGGRYYTMAALREHLTESGLTSVETYIQTGNVRFRTRMRSATRVERHVEEVLGRHCGFDVPAILLTPAELSMVRRDALGLPPPTAGETPRRYVTFFKPGEAPTGDVARDIADWDAPGERAVVVGRAVHVCIAGSMADARFFGAFKKALAPGTNRDLKVVTTLAERWGAPPGP